MVSKESRYSTIWQGDAAFTSGLLFAHALLLRAILCAEQRMKELRARGSTGQSRDGHGVGHEVMIGVMLTA